MTPEEISIRDARSVDIAEIRRFAEDHIPDHYRPLIGAEAALAQVEWWWSNERITAAIDRGGVTVAETGDDLLVGVAERGVLDGKHVLWKLYLHPDYRSQGLGPKLLRHVIGQLPVDARALRVEHIAVNRRAGAFYEREGFRYLHTEPHPVDPALDIVWRELELDRG